ncbi:MAG: DNA topoisomerase 3 [Oscillospiraceae bacterium]|nr:DNA topoisomerase 3 [Oscillospiraceae bacterium]
MSGAAFCCPWHHRQHGKEYGCLSKLVISEKPSVGQSIAKVLGATRRCDGYLEGNGYVVSWCVGHLVELAQPEAYDEKFAKWRKEDLPILPDRWQYRVSGSTKKQFSILKDLMNRNDVSTIVNACDAGREGELIFRLVYHQCKCNKPIERLWISSMEDSAIREGFAGLRPGTEYDSLYEAALCRERADWIVGINATRLFSCLYRQTLNVGRVMTPTLGMTVDREAAIAAFVPEPFYTVRLMADGCEAASERFKEKVAAVALRDACKKEMQTKVKAVERKEKQEKAPALYDLTSLQRDANRLLGFTAQQTLDYTQSVYEKKLCTYPRTDSRYLTDDMAGMLPGLVEKVSVAFGLAEVPPVHAAQVIDSSKVSDHHAIIPTKELQHCNFTEIPKGEFAVLQLIAARLLCAVGEPYRYAETTLELECAGQVFTAKGKTVLDEGWKAVEKCFFTAKSEKQSSVLPELAEGTVLPLTSVDMKEGKTTPPKHFTEDLLLQAMETASVDEFPDEAERKGIGTPATRAATIEKLVQKGFLERKGSGKVKNLIPTDKGKALITVTPEQIQSPSMTADWEEKLVQIEKGLYPAEEFIQEISGMMETMVNTYEVVKGADTLMSNVKVIGNCPHCGAEVVEREKGWFCSNRECRFVLWKDNVYFQKIGKRMTAQIAEKLVRDGRVQLKDCKSQKTGKTYNASLLLSTEADGRAKFTMEFDKDKGGKSK